MADSWAVVSDNTPIENYRQSRTLYAEKRLLEGDVPTYAQNNARGWAVTENGISQAGAANKFISGATVANISSAINDISITQSIQTNLFVGGLAGALNGGLKGAIQGGVSSALNAAIAQSGIADQLNFTAGQFGVNLPTVPGLPALGGSSPSGASGGAAAAARSGVTRSGTLPTDSPAEARTLIQDATATDVEITTDSFLQGLQGSLSSLAQGIGGILGGTLQQLMSSTALSGALGGLLGGLSEGLGKALGGFANALGNAANGILSGLGNAIQNIPGVGPVLSNMTNAIGDFAGNISKGYENLPQGAQAGVNGAIAATGAALLNKTNIGLPRISPAIAGTVVASLTMADNPAAQLRQIASTAKEVDRKTYPETRDPSFANIASAATKAAKEMEKNIQRNTNGDFQMNRNTDRAAANIKNTQVVQNGAIVPTTNTFVDNLNDVQLQSFTTYQKIINGKFAVYGSEAQILANQAYLEYVEYEQLITPETKSFVLVVEAKDAATIESLAQRFLRFYRSSKSRYTMSGL
tara:strand:+ start:1140 stop:2714 length:1575 start_codon:yes stop_codon:yes gene_type:complete